MGTRAQLFLAVIGLVVLPCITAVADPSSQPKGWDFKTKFGRKAGDKPTHWWLIEDNDLDNGGGAGRYSSIDLDSSGFPHIAYYDGDSNSVEYLYYDGTSEAWTSPVTVESGGGRWTSMQLDSNDNPHISYTVGDVDSLHTGTGELHYAFDDGSGFNIENVSGLATNAQDDATWTSLALDSDDEPHISYYDPTSLNEFNTSALDSNVHYVSKTGSNWNDDVTVADLNIQSDAGQSTSIALDSSGNPHIVYFNEDDEDVNLAVGTADTGGFSASNPGSFLTIAPVLGGEYGQHASVDIDDHDKVHVSFHDSDGDQLAYAAYAGGTWSEQAVVDTIGQLGQWTSIDSWGDYQGQVGIAYTDNGSGNLYFAYKGIGEDEWTTQMVEQGNFQYASLAFAGPNGAHISYHEPGEGLRYAISNPEPGSSLLALLSVGIGAFLVVRRKKNGEDNAEAA